jgi:fructose-1-phosphate kinase PfkB-like protein
VILVVCPNPAIDRTVLVEGLRPGLVHRGRLVSEVAGGKGFNVARALGSLGDRAVVVSPVGGEAGRRLGRLAAVEGLAAEWVEIEADTRMCTVITDGAGADTVVNEEGPPVSRTEWTRLCAVVRGLGPTSSTALVAGSLPPVGSEHPLGELSDALGSTPWWVDTSGEALRRATRLGPAGIKVNREEWGGLDRPPGVTLITTTGPGPVTVETDTTTWQASPPQGMAVVSAVGAGDCFTAGWLAGLPQGIPTALALAVAAGSDAVARLGAGVIDAAAVRRLAARVAVTRV